ncbi:protein cordon-bleu isoform X1 [Ailuropoda melanoleuca]|uniref:protein cordon-bleu isoform X1 n=1 Tax=Ailuropoda melanoleuca TaxID=9646 RepID=UPI0014940FAE|nr:protein cordon-bleu isoform X1 [Ailuropoda melanoleuca]
MKSRAPPPPGKPATPNVHSGQKPPGDVSPSPPQNLLHMKENLRNSTVAVTVVLPSGLEKKSVVNGSHAMMDLLVELCLQNHLNPSHHALEIRSSETQQPLSFKPNTLVGTLNVHTVFLKEKVPEEKVKPAPPKAPEKSVRLVVNYLRTQKAVVRVSPEVPLQNILPVICAKCEVSPEHVVLLRDNVAGEELELSKSLSELGIKELYAWDNKRETFRKSSLGNDETEKEKKKFLGFFKVNKRSSSKAEQIARSRVDSDEDTSQSALGRGSNGCLTTPNSPSVNSRSIMLGPSLSLSNISGVSVKSDLKKRRAPPPPTLLAAGPPVQDKTSEKVSLGSQIDLQKKKRRAPAPPMPQPPTPQPPMPQPPPPSPLVPSRTQDREENRKSATGVGRQVPQKPPRGSARGPPQLVLPPPPPYPPPDTDVAEPLGFPGESVGSEASDLRPTLSLPMGLSSPCGTDRVPPVLSEAEETVSVSSCFASEDTTEDSGVVSSPSDIISLDSQHDSMKSKDKWATDQEDGSDQDLAGTPELGPHKSPTWERNGSGNWHPRPEAAITPSGNEDLFFTGQFQKTLEELDEELDGLEESSEASSSLRTSSVNGVSPHCVPDAAVPECDADTIPVTFIGEVLDDPVDSGLFSNRNNNAGSFDLGGMAGKGAPPPPHQEEHSQQHGRRADVAGSPAPPHDVGKESKPTPSNPCEAVNLSKVEPKVTATASFHTRSPEAKRSGEAPGSALGGKTQASRMASSQPVNDKEGQGKNSGSAPPLWYQRGQNPGGSYGLKYGLTTYKIVPPKSEMRCYDRGVSLSTGAIKIDELGNLVSPHASGGRTIALSPSTLDLETQPIGKVKEFWRSNSLEKHSGQPTEGSAKRTLTPAMPAKPQPQEGRLRAEPTFPDPKVTSPTQQSAHREEGRHLQEDRSQPPTAAPCPMKVPAANAIEVPFLKPQRRTSSQYVASAIAKRIGPQKARTNVVRQHGRAEEPREGRAPELVGQPPTRRDGTARSPYSDGEASAVGAQPRAQVSSPSGKLSAQDSPAGVHRSPHVPPVTASQRDHVSVTLRSLSEKQSTSNSRASSASAPKRMLDNTHPPPARSGDDQTPGRTQVNGSRWVPIHAEPPHSLRGSGTNKHAGQEPLEQEEKPSLLCADGPETEGTLPPSIFGPKKKFRPVVQRPAPKDTSLHSALMEAIHSAGGKDKLRKIAEHPSEGGPRKPCYTETAGERSALLAAIQGHSGACSLRKVSSFASEELRTFREAEQSSEPPGLRDLGLQPPPALPPPPPPPPATQAPSTSRTAARSSSGNPAEARQALMDAIRSGTGAARLRKVTGSDHVSVPAGPGGGQQGAPQQ